MARHVMKIVGLADGRPTTLDGMYMVRCDVDGRDGRGEVFGTEDINAAMQFESMTELLAYWKRSSTVVPYRPDGKPNRPLTSYTIQTEPAPEGPPDLPPGVTQEFSDAVDLERYTRDPEDA